MLSLFLCATFSEFVNSVFYQFLCYTHILNTYPIVVYTLMLQIYTKVGHFLQKSLKFGRNEDFRCISKVEPFKNHPETLFKRLIYLQM